MTRASLLLLSIAAAVGCSARADLATAVEVERLTAGWVDVGIVDGQHKIVRAAVFVLRNVSDRTLGPVQVPEQPARFGGTSRGGIAAAPALDADRRAILTELGLEG